MKRSVVPFLLVGTLVFAGCGSGAKPTAHYTPSPPTTTAGVGGMQQSGIVLDQRIGPVSFAEPKPQITKALGPGVPARLNGHPLRFYPKVRIYVDYPPSPPKGKPTIALIITTRSARYKTRSGVGVGSSLRAVTPPRQGEVLRRQLGFASGHMSAREGKHQPALHRVQHRPHDQARHPGRNRPRRGLESRPPETALRRPALAWASVPE